MARDSLFLNVINSDDDNQLKPSERIFKERLLFIINIIYDENYLTDKQIHDKLIQKYPEISLSQCVRDIMYAMRVIASNIDDNGDAVKVFNRYIVEQNLKSALQIAIKKGNEYNQAFILDKMAKLYHLDEKDDEKPRYDKIVPFPFTITPSPTALGLKENEILTEAQIEQMRAKYNKFEYSEAITISNDQL